MTFQCLASIKAETYLRSCDNNKLLDLNEEDIPFKDEEAFQVSKPLFKAHTYTPEMLPRAVTENSNQLLQNLMYCLIFVNKNAVALDNENISFCRDYMEKVLNLTLRTFPQILETLPSEFITRAISKTSQFEQMSEAEKINYQTELVEHIQNPDNISYIETLNHISTMIHLLKHLKQFYLTDSELGRNLEHFLTWYEKHNISGSNRS